MSVYICTLLICTPVSNQTLDAEMEELRQGILVSIIVWCVCVCVCVCVCTRTCVFVTHACVYRCTVFTHYFMDKAASHIGVTTGIGVDGCLYTDCGPNPGLVELKLCWLSSLCHPQLYCVHFFRRSTENWM